MDRRENTHLAVIDANHSLACVSNLAKGLVGHVKVVLVTTAPAPTEVCVCEPVGMRHSLPSGVQCLHAPRVSAQCKVTAVFKKATTLAKHAEVWIGIKAQVKCVCRICGGHSHVRRLRTCRCRCFARV
jgi:hypothetical protein